MSSRSFLGTVVFPEQVCLEPFLEGGETVSVSDGGGELIPESLSQKYGTGRRFARVYWAIHKCRFNTSHANCRFTNDRP